MVENNETRPFYMGITPFNHTTKKETINYAYDFIYQNTDLILHQFETGIPWEELRYDRQYPEVLLEDIESRKAMTPDGMKVLLAMTPLNMVRTKMADAVGVEASGGGNTKEPGWWLDKSFDDDEIIQCYIKYCNYLISRFNPAFFIYGVEVSNLAHNSPQLWNGFAVLCRKTYEALKKQHPDLLISLSFQIDEYYRNEEMCRDRVAEILPYTDCIAISSYPFAFYNCPDPSMLPEDYFSRFRALAPDKPLVISETGTPSKDLDCSRDFQLHVKSNETWQEQYLEKLLSFCREENAKYFIWFLVRDYDDYWEEVEKDGAPEWYKTWMNTGLVDRYGNPKKAFATWKRWFGTARRDK